MSTTKAELLQDLNDRISAAKVSGFWTDDMKIRWLDNAGQRVVSFYRWPFLELAVTIETSDDREYYDYPSGDLRFKPNSIYLVQIEDEDYADGVTGRRRVNWNQFQQGEQQDFDEPRFANHNGFYFLDPVPENGKQLTIYGLKAWQPLKDMDDDDEIMTPPEFDEAIVRLALAACLRKAKKYSEARAEALEILDPAVGVLALEKAQIENESAGGYGGEAQSSRFNRS